MIAGVSFVAGVIHAAASIDHAGEFLLYTPVFAVFAALQMAWTVGVARHPSRRVSILGGAR